MFSDKTLSKLFGILGILLLLSCGVRLFYLQVVQHSFYEELVEMQSNAKVTFHKDRGYILDRNGRVLAKNMKVASLYTYGKNVKNPEAFVAILKQNGVNVKSNLTRSLKDNDGFVWIERHIDVEKAEGIKAKVQYVNYFLEDSRFYPEGDMFKGLIGYTGVDNQGLAGLEYHLDKTLSGREIPVNAVQDSSGKLILFDDGILNTSPDSAIYITLDAQLQGIADQILREELAVHRAKSAIVLAMDIRTGEMILSSAVERVGNNTKVITSKNYATAYLFEPGSIFKAVTFSYLIDKGLYKKDKKINVAQGITLYGHTIKDVYNYGTLTQEEVFTKSSNIGTVMLIKDTSKEEYYNHLIKSGFGNKLGISGVTEEAGVLRPPNKWSGLSIASLSIGQEIMVTPVQMVRYFAALANDGVAMKPLIISNTIDKGSSHPSKPEGVRIMSSDTSKVLMGLLNLTVETGTGRRAKTGVMQIGGKTGTGQVIDPKTNTYSKSDYVAGFAGIFPMDDPKVAMLVLFDSPRSSIYGGASSAPTFRRIAEQLAFFYSIGGDVTKVTRANN